MCKYKTGCKGNCRKCRADVKEVTKVQNFDASNLPRGPRGEEGDVFVPDTTGSIFDI